MRTFGFLAAAGVATCLFAGCGSSSEVALSREQAGAAFNEGLAAFNSRDYATAANKLAAAIDSGGLNADIYSSASVKLVVAYAATGKYPEAEAVLAKLEQAPNQDQVLAARSFLLAKQGKAAEAQTAFLKARQLNRTIQPFK